MADEIDVLRALAHPVRWGILERLAAEPGICACSFTEYFDVSQPTISAHLKALRQAGLVTTQRRGTEIWYSLARDQLAPLAAGLPASPRRVRPWLRLRLRRLRPPRSRRPWFRQRWFRQRWFRQKCSKRRCRTPPPAGLRRRPIPAVDARSPGRLADVVAAAARIPGSLADPPPLAARASGGLAAAAAAAQAAAQAARGPSGDEGVADRPAAPQRSRGLADMAAMAQAALPRGAGRRGRIPRQRGAGGRPSAAGSAEEAGLVPVGRVRRPGQRLTCGERWPRCPGCGGPAAARSSPGCRRCAG